MTWQTIETAPKDGDTILVCDNTGHICCAFWYETKFSRGKWCDGCDDGHSVNAKYWMPLPPPPEDV